MTRTQRLLKIASLSQLSEAKVVMYKFHPGDPEHKEAEINFKIVVDRLKQARKAGVK